MKVALVNAFDSKNIKNWSGIPYYMSIFLESLFGQTNVDCISIPLKRSYISYLKNRYHDRIAKTYISEYDRSVLKASHKNFDIVRKGGYDLIITFQFFLIPNFKTDKSKIILWTDATFDNILNFYNYLSNLSWMEIASIHRIQRKALQMSDAIIFTSKWATNSAINRYKTAPEKLTIASFTSNLSRVPDEEEVEQIIEHRSKEEVKLLFLGVDWDRKGGNETIRVLDALNDKGIKTTLYIVGTTAPEACKDNRNIRSLGFINKNTEEGEKTIIELLKDCHFLILPSKADCTPVAFSEANSFAVPVITTNVGGISSIIVNEVNGHYFENEDFESGATNFIEKIISSPSLYTQLCNSSYRHYINEASVVKLEHTFRAVLNKLFPGFN